MPYAISNNIIPQGQTWTHYGVIDIVKLRGGVAYVAFIRSASSSDYYSTRTVEIHRSADNGANWSLFHTFTFSGSPFYNRIRMWGRNDGVLVYANNQYENDPRIHHITASGTMSGNEAMAAGIDYIFDCYVTKDGRFSMIAGKSGSRNYYQRMPGPTGGFQYIDSVPTPSVPGTVRYMSLSMAVNEYFDVVVSAQIGYTDGSTDDSGNEIYYETARNLCRPSGIGWNVYNNISVSSTAVLPSESDNNLFFMTIPNYLSGFVSTYYSTNKGINWSQAANKTIPGIGGLNLTHATSYGRGFWFYAIKREPYYNESPVRYYFDPNSLTFTTTETVVPSWTGNYSYAGNVSKVETDGQSIMVYESYDGANRTPITTSRTRALYIPNVAPNAPVLHSPSNGGWYNTGSPTVSWSFSDPDAGNYQGAWAVHIIDNNTNVVVRDTGWVSGQAASWVISPALSSGTYRYRVITQDQNGAQGPYSGEPVFYVDTVAPTGNARVTQTYTAESTFRVYADNVTDNMGVAYVDAYMQNLAQNSWVYQGRATQSGTTWYYNFPVSNEGNGNRLTRFHAVDHAGNSSAGIDTWVYYDTVAPTTTNHNFTGYAFGSATNASSGNLRLNWTYNDATPQSHYQVLGTNTAWTTLNYNTGMINSGNTFHDIPFSSLSEGLWYFSLVVLDSQTNPSVSSGGYYIYIDRSVPTIGGITGTTYTNSATQRMHITGASDSISGIQRVDAYIMDKTGIVWSGPYSATNAGGGTWYYDFNAAYEGDGGHSVRFLVYDKAGNVTYMDSVIVYDTSKPIIGSGDGNRYSNQNSGTIRHTISNVSDATSGTVSTRFQLRKSTDNGATWGAWSSNLSGIQNGTSWYYDIPISGDGRYQVDVVAIDRAGNSSVVYTMFTTIDSQLANDPNPTVVYGTTTATFSWNLFSDPNPSSGRKTTDFYLGEWNGSSYVGTMLYNGSDIGNVTSITVNNLEAGKRYRYTVTYHDNAGNESSYTYKEFITKKKIGTSRVKTGSSEVTLPIYDLSSGVLGNKSVRIGNSSGSIGCFELVPTTDPNASSIRFSTSQGILAFSK